ncbi:MAG TPA: S9 family peptidase [Phycisphaerae bacterium]|nr:S9 family peptidase [Phycisphaerae bacterium]
MCARFSLPVLLAINVLLLPLGVQAQETARDHQITPDDYFTVGVITDCAASPDGRHVAYTESRWEPPADKRNMDLWVVETATREVTRLTFESAADSTPKWSPDGKWIYFTSSRERGEEKDPPYNGKTQVWRVGVEGGPIFPVTRVKDGVDHYDLSADGKTLYYVVGEKKVDPEWKELYEKHEHITYGHGVVKYSQVWALDLQSWRAEKLVDEKRVVGALAVAPDGKRLAMITTPTEETITNEGQSRVDIFDRQSKEMVTLPDRQWREDAPSPYGWLENLAWSRDGSSLAFRVDFDGFPSEIFVAQLAGGDAKIQKLTRPDEVHVTGGRMAWRGTSKDLCFLAEDHARVRVYCITDIGDGRQGPVQTLTPGDVCAETFSLPTSGSDLAVVMSGITHPPDVFSYPATPPVQAPSGTRLTRVNPQVDTWRIPQISLVSWKGWNGDTVEGILELPPDHTPGKPLPMVVELHGGPTAASLFRFRFWIYGRVLWAARGYAVFSPNYRGSTGYGDKFLTELVGHKNDRDVTDILTGVDAMVERGIADPDRLGVMGWSNGGYLTNCVITQTDRFKCASSGAGILDAAMQWASEDTPGHVINFQRGFPWNRSEEMRAASPLYAADKIKTPTIIHVGEKDTRCPPAHSKGLFRALHEYIKVPTQLVIYPGEGHSPMTYKNRKAKLDWDIGWFDKYLPLDEEPAEKAEPEDKPIS